MLSQLIGEWLGPYCLQCPSRIMHFVPHRIPNCVTIDCHLLDPMCHQLIAKAEERESQVSKVKMKVRQREAERRIENRALACRLLIRKRNRENTLSRPQQLANSRLCAEDFLNGFVIIRLVMSSNRPAELRRIQSTNTLLPSCLNQRTL